MSSYNTLYTSFYGGGLNEYFSSILLILICSFMITLALIYREHHKSGEDGVNQKFKWFTWIISDSFCEKMTTIVIIFVALYIGFTAFKEFTNPYKTHYNYLIVGQTGQKHTKEARCLTSPDGIHFCEIDEKVYKVRSYEKVTDFEEYFPEY